MKKCVNSISEVQSYVEMNLASTRNAFELCQVRINECSLYPICRGEEMCFKPYHIHVHAFRLYRICMQARDIFLFTSNVLNNNQKRVQSRKIED